MHYLTEVVKVLFFRASRVPENVIELHLKARQICHTVPKFLQAS